MKNNAIVRIVIWSIVILLLVGILAVSLGGIKYTVVREQTVAATMEPEMIEPDLSDRREVAVDGNIHATPNESSPVKGTVRSGETVLVIREENIGGSPWCYVAEPEQGWILKEFIQESEATIPEDAAADIDVSGELRFGTVTKTVNVRKSPSMMDENVGKIEAGESITICKQETIDGHKWAQVTSPVPGWIIMDVVQLDEADTANAPAGNNNDTGSVSKDEKTRSGKVTQTVNVRKSPSLQDEIAGSIMSGESITICKQETIDGRKWAQVTSPVPGWIIMDVVQLDEADTVTAPAGNSNTVNSFSKDEISKISINWAAGNVVIESADVENILVREEGGSSKYPIDIKLRKGKLDIDFCGEDIFHGFGLHLDFSKDLFIQVPKDWVCKELELDAASAPLEIRNMTIQEVDIDTASGKCVFENCQVDSLEIDTASGDVEFTGNLNSLEFDAASASFTGMLTNVPRRIEVDSLSGDIDLTLPEGAGFSAKIDSMSGDFSSEFATTSKNGSFVHGDGSCRIEMSGMSSDLIIRKGTASEAPTTPTTPETPTAP